VTCLGVSIPPGWDVTPIYRDGHLAGFFCTQGNEIHAYRSDDFKGRWLTHQDIERLTKPLFERYGFVQTRVRTSNDTGHKFVQRLGFTKTGEDGGLTLYRAERLNHARF
jgi:hypothetical protein